MERLKIGIDLDGTITEYPAFFRAFTAAMQDVGCRIYILTDRPEGTEDIIRYELDKYGVGHDVIKITFNKVDYIREEGIQVVFEDMEKYFADLPEEVAVFKIRQKFNFDFKEKKWRDNQSNLANPE